VIDPANVVHRADELRAEIARGELALAALDRQRAELVTGLVRLNGAVVVLEELLAAEARRATVPG
jgi:hypothetical protein